MYLRIFVPGILFMALVADQPCFAKESHSHGTRTRTTIGAASGKGSNAKPAPSKASAPIEPEQTVTPPVLPPHDVSQHQFRVTNPVAKSVINAPHNQAGAMTSTTPAGRNAIGQPAVSAKNLFGAQPGISPAQRTSGVVSPPIVSPHLNVGTAANHGSINGAAAIRPVIAPAGVGGPAQVHYGITGMTVQSKH